MGKEYKTDSKYYCFHDKFIYSLVNMFLCAVSHFPGCSSRKDCNQVCGIVYHREILCNVFCEPKAIRFQQEKPVHRQFPDQFLQINREYFRDLNKPELNQYRVSMQADLRIQDCLRNIDSLFLPIVLHSSK